MTGLVGWGCGMIDKRGKEDEGGAGGSAPGRGRGGRGGVPERGRAVGCSQGRGGLNANEGGCGSKGEARKGVTGGVSVEGGVA